MAARKPAKKPATRMARPIAQPTTPSLPPKPTRAQKDAAAKLALTPAQQKTAWTTTSTFGDRLKATHAELDKLLRRLFPSVEPTFEYNMHGWKIRRKATLHDWKGTLDPNWIRIGVAERKQGITLHVWNPYRPMDLNDPRLNDAGYKVMVGCLQYNRKGPVPVAALEPMFAAIAKAWKAEKAS